MVKPLNLPPPPIKVTSFNNASYLMTSMGIWRTMGNLGKITKRLFKILEIAKLSSSFYNYESAFYTKVLLFGCSWGETGMQPNTLGP